jgi:CrcB protein
MVPLLWVCLGGALGSGARHLVGVWAAAALPPSFPFGTLLVNVVGSFVMALVMKLALATDQVPHLLRLFLTTGILGGFTTYSTFNWETLHLIEEGRLAVAALDVGVTVAACLLAGVVGLKAGGAISGW